MWNNSLIQGSSFFQKRLFAMFGGRVTSATPVWYWFLTWTNKSIHCLWERINFTQKSVGFRVFLKLPFLTNTFVPTNFVSLELCSFKHSPGTKQHIPEKSSKIKLQTGKPPNTGLWSTLRQAAKVKSLSKTSSAAPRTVWRLHSCSLWLLPSRSPRQRTMNKMSQVRENRWGRKGW